MKQLVQVSEITGFPEVMDGRVKTLHPKIHMSLLARQDHADDLKILDQNAIAMIDLLVVNLYPFVEQRQKNLSEKELVEFIDVGGPSMIRAGAKNFERIVTLTRPQDYALLDKEEIDYKQRKYLSGLAFKHLSDYNEQISNYLLNKDEKNKDEKSASLRYGENPHQKANWVYSTTESGLQNAEIIQGKELSFNNLVDLTAAVETLNLFKNKPTAVSVKHNNPCGVGEGKTIEEALNKSLKADPMSVFGGIVALNSEVNKETAQLLTSIFLECVVAPSITEEAKKIISTKKNLRLLIWPQMNTFIPSQDFKRVSGGRLFQDVDQVFCSLDEWKQVSGSQVEAEVKEVLEFAWKVVSRLKSNAIAVCGLGQSLGLGMGQVNRVDAVESAIQRWKRFHSDYEGPVVLASDAFFPFADSIKLISEAGIKWVVQPGGSIKDEEVIKAAKDLGVNMVFTGQRHFLH